MSVSGIGQQDDVTFIWSAATRNRNWSALEDTLTEPGHRLRIDKCGVWSLGCKQHENQNLPREIRGLCAKVPRERQGISLFGSAANAQQTTGVQQGELAETPAQTSARPCEL